MTQINEILDMELLAREEAEGYVRRRLHPEFPELSILNYSEKTQYENRWNEVTLKCRGLIYNTESGEVLARPFAKFFNYGDDTNGPQIDPDSTVYWVGDKADGSLGIGYIRPDGRAAIATRGSFESEQAIHATDELDYEEGLDIENYSQQGYTRLYEIIYPENRIVLDYGDRDELILLGAVRNDNGAYLPPRKNDVENLKLVRDVLGAEPRPNAEGYVIWTDPFTAIKLKQQDYLELHKIVTGLNRKSVWRALAAGEFEEMAAILPDEFHDWARGVAEELWDEYETILYTAQESYIRVSSRVGLDRKSQALWIQEFVDNQYRGLVFSLLDGRDIAPKIWSMIEPEGGER